MPLQTTLEILNFRFTFHMSSLAPDNPLTQLKIQFTGNKHQIIPITRKHPWQPQFREYLNTKTKENISNKLTQSPQEILDEFIELKKKEEKSIGKLSTYIKWNGQSLDNSILFKSPRAFNWRANYYLTRRKCICQLKFTRGHLTRCKLLEDSPEAQTILKDKFFIAATNQIKELNGTYTILDHCINENNEAAFDAICDHIEKLLPSA
jgi:hypothetical protein